MFIKSLKNDTQNRDVANQARDFHVRDTKPNSIP